MRSFDYMKMSKYEADAVRKSAASTLEEGHTIANKLLSRIRNLESNLDIEKKALDASNSLEIHTNILSISDEVYTALRLAANDLQYLSTCPPYVQAVDNPQAETERYYKKIMLPQDRVASFLEEDAIYVRTPMLWSRNNRKIRGDKGRTIGPERFTMYRDSVYYSILIDPRYFGYNFERFRKKILHFLYVYHDLPNNQMYLIDNDNHETKNVTDAIVKFLPAGDTPLYCNFYSSAIITKDIPEGTYITVTAAEDGVKSDDNIVGFWKEKFEQIPKTQG